MTKTLDLINAIEAGQSIKIHSLFEELVNARLVDAIEQRRAEIADLVFNGNVDESVELDEEFVDEMSQYDISDIVDFALSEDFKSLDELSKKTLGSYIKKASGKQLLRKELQRIHREDGKKSADAGDAAASDASKKNYNSTMRKIIKTDAGISKAVDRLVK